MATQKAIDIDAAINRAKEKMIAVYGAEEVSVPVTTIVDGEVFYRLHRATFRDLLSPEELKAYEEREEEQYLKNLAEYARTESAEREAAMRAEFDAEEEDTNPYLLTGDELERTIAARKAGR